MLRRVSAAPRAVRRAVARPVHPKATRRGPGALRDYIALALGLKLVLAAGAVVGLTSLVAAVLVGDMGGSLAVTLNAIRLAQMKD